MTVDVSENKCAICR